MANRAVTRVASLEKNVMVYETSPEADPKPTSPMPDLDPSWEMVARNVTSKGLVDLDVVCPCTKESPCLLDKLILEERMERKKRAIDKVVRQSMMYCKQKIFDFETLV